MLPIQKQIVLIHIYIYREREGENPPTPLGVFPAWEANCPLYISPRRSKKTIFLRGGGNFCYKLFAKHWFFDTPIEDSPLSAVSYARIGRRRIWWVPHSFLYIARASPKTSLRRSMTSKSWPNRPPRQRRNHPTRPQVLSRRPQDPPR